MLLSFIYTIAHLLIAAPQQSELDGAYENTSEDGTQASWIISDGFFSIAYYTTDSVSFKYTEGGSISVEDGQMKFTWEYHTQKPELVGETRSYDFKAKKKKLIIEGAEWTRIDDGTPGDLNAAWLITGRKQGEEMTERKSVPGER